MSALDAQPARASGEFAIGALSSRSSRRLGLVLRGVVDVPDCAHWTQQERPDLVTAALLDFLRGL
jgi:pimeloyl-ACP methyl ester carboxylesterase